jgi:hypothetical protein
LQQVPKGVFRKLLLDQLDQLTGMAANTSAQITNPNIPPGPPSGPQQTGFVRPAPRTRITVEMPPCIKAVNLLIRRPALVRLMQHEDELAEIRADGMELLLKVAEIARLCPDASSIELMSRIFATAYGGQLTSLLGRELLTPEDGMEHEFSDLLAQMLQGHRQRLARQTLLQDLRRRHARLQPDGHSQPAEN